MDIRGSTVGFERILLKRPVGSGVGHGAAVRLPSLMALLCCMTACPGSEELESRLPATGSDDAAATYCTASGGEVETRYPFYGTNQDDPLRLSGSLEVCSFTADDDTRIIIGLDTLYTDEPTLAALAYRAQTPMEPSRTPSANPSSLYCTQLGGTDTFGGVGSAGGGWGLDDGADSLALCVFPDLSVIDSWGITYHADGTIRGADLDELLGYSE
jgi:putative hemolysin